MIRNNYNGEFFAGDDSEVDSDVNALPKSNESLSSGYENDPAKPLIKPLPAEVGMQIEHVDEEILSMVNALFDRAQKLYGPDSLEGQHVLLEASAVKGVLSGIYAAFTRKRLVYAEAGLKTAAEVVEEQRNRLKTIFLEVETLPDDVPIHQNLLEKIKSHVEYEIRGGRDDR